jgi:tRNA threonylcarbamoyladenosine biosynthesis protein TsaE
VTPSRAVLQTTTPDRTRRLGAALGSAAQPGDVFLLEGSFGVGKTVLVQGLAEGLGVVEPVTSPSFVLMVEHRVPSRGKLRLVHVDLYRLDGRLDEEMLDHVADAAEADAVCAIEWPDALPAEFRGGATTITMEALDEATRQITVASPHPRLLTAVRDAVEAV